MHKTLIALAVFLCVAIVVHGDLPVHCEYDAIHGAWTFQLTANNMDRNVMYSPCVFNQPLPLPAVKQLHLDLRPPNVAVDMITGTTGTWTLIYDQGFEIRLDSNKYFAFFNYTQTGSKVVSHCGNTFTGWYHANVVNASGSWGCMQGAKKTQVPDSVMIDEDSLFQQRSLTFRNNHKYIDALNKAQKSWTATAYPQFEGLPMSKFVRMLGRRTNQARRLASRRHVAQMRASFKRLQHDSSMQSPTSVQDIPANFDWRNSTMCGSAGCVSPVRNQASCGSCFAFASTGMFEARVRVQTKGASTPIFSPQDDLNCDNYNQACNGGFSFSVSKYGQDFGIALDSCAPYEARKGPCVHKCPESTRTYIRDYNYLGGYYGGCTEELMMQAIYNHGPIAVDFEVYSDFYHYRSGIYHHVKLDESLYEPDPHWEEANHVVVAVGFGVSESGEKYWIVKNSWSASWGMQGYFLIRRGVDECAIESAGVESFPITN